MCCWTSFDKGSGEEEQKNPPFKVKCLSSVEKSTIEDLQKKDSTLKKEFDPVGNPIIREKYIGEFFMKNGLLTGNIKNEDRTKFQPVSHSKGTFDNK